MEENNREKKALKKYSWHDFLLEMMTTMWSVGEEHNGQSQVGKNLFRLVRHVQCGQVVEPSSSTPGPHIDPNNTPPFYHPTGIGAGYGQQYASFEELQKLVENPFENNTAVNLTVPLGDTAYLRCKVRNLGERTVISFLIFFISWVRRRDWHILTSGVTTYTNDERFNSLHVDGTDDWTLQIKFLQKRDNGTYECQVSSIKSLFYSCLIGENFVRNF
ncbi:Lachesin [Folsomia candida]|uniref:Lachesin n=1 Tax=Folsomia candida TaxID=158441 RepID=A0A226CW17_FOLCA|nr:Lachesin [Folsomia candida]